MNSFFAHVNSVSSALSGPQWLTREQSLPVAPQGSLARDSSSVWTSHSCYLIWWVQEDGSPEAMPLLCALACILGPPGGPLVAGWPSMGHPQASHDQPGLHVLLYSHQSTTWAQCLDRQSSLSFYLQGPDYT